MSCVPLSTFSYPHHSDYQLFRKPSEERVNIISIKGKQILPIKYCLVLLREMSDRGITVKQGVFVERVT